jgi:CRP/FNR family transcriptional regulator, cyclic AMP receptor protein
MPTFTLFKNEPDVRTFSAGQLIFAEGQPDDDLMYAVLEGEVDIIRQQQVLETVLPGSVFGEMALLDNQPRSASAVAKTDCRVAAITEKRFTLVVSQNPHFALDMMRLLTERVRRNMTS